jgi:accessory colonization factor AcfC
VNFILSKDDIMNILPFGITFALMALPAVVSAANTSIQAGAGQDTPVLHVYGPGGPLPALKEAADAFGKEKHIQIVVTGGPEPKWLYDAQQTADLIFSGSEDMMSDFQVAMQGALDPTTITPLYLREAAILVRPGNPTHIKGLQDLMKPGHRILVVNGAGQKGLWEDVAGRQGDIASVAKFRANIAIVSSNSGDARTDWINDKSLDAWLIWNIWQVSNPSLAEIVSIDEAHQIYRDCGIGLTTQGKSRPEAREFIRFLQSPQGAKIFQKWGWIVQR